MATVFLSPIGNGAQFFTAGGLPLNGGFINTYLAGTNTPQPTYTTSLGTIANANPIVLGNDGRTTQEIWLTQGITYKFVITDSLSNILGTYDNLYGISDYPGAVLIGAYYSADTGTVNAMAATLNPVPASQAALLGIPITINVGISNSSAVTLNVNSLGIQNLIDLQGNPILPNSLISGSVITVVWNGSNYVWQGAPLGLRSNGYGIYNASATLTSADVGRAAYFNNGTAGTLTLPAFGSFPVGSSIALYNLNSGALTITASGGASIIYAFGLQAVASIVLSQGDSVLLTSTGSIWVGTLGASGLNSPAFSVYQSVAQSIATNTSTKLQFQAKEFDTANNFDTVTNFRYTASVAGYYQVSGGFQIASVQATLGLYIAKNNVLFKTLQALPSNTSSGVYGSALIQLNVGDYIELFVTQGAAAQNSINTSLATFFQGAMIRKV